MARDRRASPTAPATKARDHREEGREPGRIVLGRGAEKGLPEEQKNKEKSLGRARPPYALSRPNSFLDDALSNSLARRKTLGRVTSRYWRYTRGLIGLIDGGVRPALQSNNFVATLKRSEFLSPICCGWNHVSSRFSPLRWVKNFLRL